MQAYYPLTTDRLLHRTGYIGPVYKIVSFVTEFHFGNLIPKFQYQ